MILASSSYSETTTSDFMTAKNKLSAILLISDCVETILKFILLAYSISGITLTLITSCIFLKYRSTPVVKSASKELCYIMLVGMIGAHSTTIIITTTEHTIATCIILRIVPPISFTCIYGALLVKTNRLARILTISKRKFPNMRPRLISIGSQVSTLLYKQNRSN